MDEAALIFRAWELWKDLLSVTAPPGTEGRGSLKGAGVLERVEPLPLVCIGADLEKRLVIRHLCCAGGSTPCDPGLS